MGYISQTTSTLIKISLILFTFFIFNNSNSISKEVELECHQAENLIISNFWALIPTDNVIFYNLQYQRKVTCKNTFGIDLKIPANSNIDGYAIGVEYRHYFFKDAFDGFYLSPGISRVFLNESKNPEEVEIFSFNILAAYSLILGKHFTFDLGLGLTYNTGPYLQNKELAEGTSNTLPNIRFAMGWAF